MLKSHFSSAQQGLPPCPALCSGYCSYFQGLKKICITPFTLPARYLILSPLPGSPQCSPFPQHHHGSAGPSPPWRAMARGCPRRAAPGPAGQVGAPQLLRLSQTDRKQEDKHSRGFCQPVVPALPLPSQLLQAAGAWQTPAARPRSAEGTGELANVELGHVIKAKRANLESC